MSISSETANILTFVSFLFGIISFVYALYCQYKTKKAEKQQQTINWKDVSIAAKDLAKQIGVTCHPDIIYIPSIKSGIIAHFIKDYFSEYIPVITGQIIPKRQFTKNDLAIIKNSNQYLIFETNKWYAYVPKTIISYKENQLLIIDDFAMSGDFLDMLTKILSDNGFNPSKITTSCIATTDVAIKSGKAPTYYWKKFSTIDVYLPWGKPI